MGGGIAQVLAASGRRVSLHDAAPGAVERGLETMRRSLEKLAEKGGSDPDEVLARVEPVEGIVEAELMIEAVVEDAGVKDAIFREADKTLPPRRHPRVEHLLHPDHHAGGRNRAAATGNRDALLQPGAADVAGRGHPCAADLGRDGRRHRGAGARAGEDACRGERFPGLRLQPHSHAVHQRGRLRAAGRRRRGRGDRHHCEARLQPSHRTARARRPDRARHVRLDHGGAARGAAGRQVRAVPAAARARRRAAASAARAARASTRTHEPRQPPRTSPP